MTSAQQRRKARGAFAAAVAGNGPVNLTEAALLIGAEDDPLADLADARARLRALVDGAADLAAARAPADAAQALARHLHDRAGLHGNHEDYYQPANSHLHRVLESRAGIPVSLAVVYLHVARAHGLAATGIGFPGHFLVGIGSGQTQVLLDPWAGEVLDPPALAALAERCQVPSSRLGGALAPVSERAILARMLANLREIHRARSDHLAVLACCDRAVLAAPDAPAERLERAACYVALEAFGLAQAELSALLDHVPAGPLREDITRRLGELAGRARTTLH